MTTLIDWISATILSFSFQTMNSSIVKEVSQIQGVISIEPYQPENFKDFSRYAVWGLTSERYAQCVSGLNNDPMQFFSVTYQSDSYKVKGFVGLPKYAEPNKKLPLIEYIRGGNREFGRINACSLRMTKDLFGADRNYVLILPQFRGVAGGEGQEEFGGAEITDVLALMEIGKKISYADPKNTFISGWSRGGMMTYLALKNQIEVNAAIVIAGPTDLFLSEQERPEKAQVHRELIPDYKNDREHLLRDRSMIYWPELINKPLLIVQGTADQRVSLKQAEAAFAKLDEHHKIYKKVIYPGEDHGLDNATDDLRQQVRTWIEANTK